MVDVGCNIMQGFAKNKMRIEHLEQSEKVLLK